MCHVSHVTCHLSPVTCHLSPVNCHLSHVNFFLHYYKKKWHYKKYWSKWWSLLVEGLLSTGPTPSSLFLFNSKYPKSWWSPICSIIFFPPQLLVLTAFHCTTAPNTNKTCDHSDGKNLVYVLGTGLKPSFRQAFGSPGQRLHKQEAQRQWNVLRDSNNRFDPL